LFVCLPFRLISCLRVLVLCLLVCSFVCMSFCSLAACSHACMCAAFSFLDVFSSRVVCWFASLLVLASVSPPLFVCMDLSILSLQTCSSRKIKLRNDVFYVSFPSADFMTFRSIKSSPCRDSRLSDLWQSVAIDDSKLAFLLFLLSRLRAALSRFLNILLSFDRSSWARWASSST
jgi:hypothetical protein